MSADPGRMLDAAATRAAIEPEHDPEVVIDVVAMVTVTINQRTGRVVRRALTEHGQVVYLADADGGSVETWEHADTNEPIPPGAWDDDAEILASWALARYREQLLADAACHYPIMPAIQENTDPDCWTPPRRGWSW